MDQDGATLLQGFGECVFAQRREELAEAFQQLIAAAVELAQVDFELASPHADVWSFEDISENVDHLCEQLLL